MKKNRAKNKKAQEETLKEESERALVDQIRRLHALQPDVQPRIVHHREHRAHAAMLRPDQLADAIVMVAERQHAGRRGVQAHLVLDRHDAHVVERARRAVVVQAELGDEEQADPARSRGRIGRPGEDEVDDVVRHVVVAERDEDLGALDRPLAVSERRPAGRMLNPGTSVGRISDSMSRPGSTRASSRPGSVSTPNSRLM